MEDEADDVVDLPDPETTCEVCYAEFLDPEDLKIHVSQVHALFSKRCKFCPAIFSNLESYAFHIRDDHMSNFKCCKYCSRVFLEYDQFRKHQSRHYNYIPKSRYSCSHCKTLFTNIYELEQHEVKMHFDSDDGVLLHDCYSILSTMLNIKADTFVQSWDKNLLYTCVVCHYKTSKMSQYLHHLKKKGCRSLSCDKCYKVYTKRKNLYKHYNDSSCKVYINIKKCTECNKLFDTFIIKEHMKNCKAYKCKACNITFNAMYELSEHQTKEHPLAITLEYCKYCRKDFVGKVALDKHIKRSHKNELHLFKYNCVYCNAIFKHPKMLFTHFYGCHKELEPYTCKLCDKKFKIRKKFTIHIKLDHKGEGFVEFDDNYHVYFTDKKSEKPFIPMAPVEECCEEDDTECKDLSLNPDSVDSRAKDKSVNIKDDPNINSDFMNMTETEGNQTEIDTENKTIDIKKPKQKRKTKITTSNARKKIKKSPSVTGRENLSDLDTDDDDQPLIVVKKKSLKSATALKNSTWNRKKRKGIINDNKKRFTCNICKKYCYTFQNYHNHVSLHFKHEKKKCIKCSKIFKSRKALSEHVASEHTTSILTETLKNLLKRRQNKNANDSSTNASLTQESARDRFMKTIKKVCVDKSDAVVTVTEVPNDGDGLSVQKFIENFTPDTSNETAKKVIKIDSCVTMKMVMASSPKKSIINMKKFNPSPLKKGPIKLAMPLKFKQVPRDNDTATIKLVQKYEYDTPFHSSLKVHTNENHQILEQDYNYFETDHYEEVEDDDKSSSNIPEVAQEVMLESNLDTNEESPKNIQIPHKIVIPQVPNQEYSKIRIAHLLPEAPYYKIVKFNEILKGKDKPKPLEEKKEEVKLPQGTKLINVNPLAHLLKGTPVENLVQKTYYQPKNHDFKKAIAKALLQLENPQRKKKKLLDVEQ